MSTPDQKAWAHGLVAAFRKRTTNVAWFNVQRAQVADELDVRTSPVDPKAGAIRGEPSPTVDRINTSRPR